MKLFHIKSAHLDDDVFIEAGRYHDGSLALRLVTEIGEPAGVATVCLSHLDEKPSEGNVFIKDWSENEGFLSALQKEGIVGDKIREVKTGFTTAYEVALLIPLDDGRVRLLG